jgi:hypothetical protein
MKKILLCGMMLGLLTAVSWAQRGRTIGGGGITSGARIPNAGAISPHAGMNPNAMTMPHGGVFSSATTAPNAVTTTSKNPKRVTPNATFDPTASTVGSHTENSSPDRVVLPDAHTGPAPER